MLLDSFDHAEEDVSRALLAEQRVEAERILAAARRGHGRHARAARPTRDRAAIAAALAAVELAQDRQRPPRHPRRHRGARPRVEAVRRAADEPGPRARAARPQRRRGPGADGSQALGRASGGAARTKVIPTGEPCRRSVSSPTASRSRCRWGRPSSRPSQQGARPGRLRLRRRLRLLDLPRLRQAGAAAAVARRATARRTSWTRRSTCGRPRASAARPSSCATRTIVVEISRESRQAFLDEHPEIRNALAQAQAGRAAP